MNEEDLPSACASPPCFMREIADGRGALARDEGVRLRTDVKRWRKAERERLIAGRLAVPNDVRAAHAEDIAAALEKSIGAMSGLTVSAYWPFRGEPDLRPFMDRMTARGARCALPVVVERATPLVFRAWRSGDRLERGIWNIPVPADGADVQPDVVVAPVVGFDPLCYRLGYGGGYFDRSLAALSPRPRAVGVGFELARVDSIRPQAYDLPMDFIVTEAGAFEVANGRLQPKNIL